MWPAQQQEAPLGITMWVSRDRFLLKELFEEMANSRPGSGNVRDKPGTPCHTRQQRNYQILVRSCPKNSEDKLNRLPLAKDSTHWASISITTKTDANSSNMYKYVSSEQYWKYPNWSLWSILRNPLTILTTGRYMKRRKHKPGGGGRRKT